MTQKKQRMTKAEKLYAILSDGRWHSTLELVRRVGHTFGGAKFKLVTFGYIIQKERQAGQHPRRPGHPQ